MRKIFATLLLFCACSTPHSFSIAIDPASMPIHLLAYTKDLMGNIATKENLTLSLTQRSWVNLTERLDEELYPAMIST